MVVGGISPRKNLDILPEVLKGIRNGGLTVTVVKVGQSLPPGLAKRIREAGGSAASLLEVGRVDDTQLSVLYQNAAFTFFPSTYEGFGLPVLEAMAHGCPVICSNATSIPEVGGNAVLYFSPHDTATAIHHALALLASAELRESLRKNGQCRARSLSWKTHWEKISAIYAHGIEAQIDKRCV
jgi:glycosyltransferase involved in cell wall biosynthesis